MKRGLIAMLFLLMALSLRAQQEDSVANKNTWDFSAQLYLCTSSSPIAMPVFSVVRNHLSLETTYNYNAPKTFTASAGYIFSGGNKFSFEITPMAGIMLGKVNGFLPELNLDLSYGSFNLSGDVKYLVNVEHPKLNYWNTTNDLTYYPTDWLYAGISVQRARIFQTHLNIQRGIVAGVVAGKLTLMSYLFNFLNKKSDIFGLFGIEYDF